MLETHPPGGVPKHKGKTKHTALAVSTLPMLAVAQQESANTKDLHTVVFNTSCREPRC